MAEDMLDFIFGNTMFDAFLNWLSWDLFGSGGEGKFTGALSNLVNSVHDSVIQPFAVMLMFIYFMIAIVDKLSSENFTWEELWRLMAKFIVAKLLIDHGLELLQLIYSLGISLLLEIPAMAPEAVEYDSAAMIESFKENLDMDSGVMLKFLGEILCLIFLMIPWLFSIILVICMMLIVLSRTYEIYLRALFIPIAISDFFHAGLNGSGWQYIKTFMAISLQCVLILLIYSFHATVTHSMLGEMMNWSLDMIALCFYYLGFSAAAISLMFKTLSLSKEIVGVH